MKREEEIDIIIKNIVEDLERTLQQSAYQDLKIDYIITAGKLLEEYKTQLKQLKK